MSMTRRQLYWIAASVLFILIFLMILTTALAPRKNLQSPEETQANNARIYDTAPLGTAKNIGSTVQLTQDFKRQNYPGPRPAFLPVDQWNQLIQSLESDPNRQAELPRVVAYLSFQHLIQTWQNQPIGSKDRTQTAQEILEKIPQHVMQQEVSAGEALALQTRIYQELIADEAERKLVLVKSYRQLLETANHTPEIQAQIRQDQGQYQQYKTRELEILDRYKTAQINAEQLDKELTAARNAAYN